MGNPQQVRQIRVVVDTKGNRDLRDLADAMSGVSRNTKSLASNMGFLKNAFLGYFAALRVQELVQMSDTMQLLFDRITVLSGGADKARETFANLLATANRSRVDISDLADTYARFQQTLSDTGASSGAVLQITELLANSYRLSGTSAESARGSLIQLSQSFQTGALRGDELRSVLEGNAELAKILSREYGKDLFKKAKEGAITTAEVLRLLFKEQTRINSQAQELRTTFGQSLVVAMNDFKFKLNEINDQFNLSGKFAVGLQAAIDSLKYFGVLLAIMAVTQIPAAVAAIKSLTLAIYTLVASNPITALFAAIGVAVVYIITHFEDFKNSLKEIGAALLDFPRWLLLVAKDVALVMEGITFGSDKAAKSLDPLINKITDLGEGLLASRKFTNSPTDTVDEVTAFLKAEKERKDLLAALNKGKVEKEGKLKEILGEINKKFLDGKISAEQYQTALNTFDVYKLTRQFKEGKVDLEKFTLQLSELDRQRLGQELARNAISMEDFNNKVRESKIEDLNTKLRAGTINLKEYNAEFIKLTDKLNYGGALQVGLQTYVDGIGTASSMLADSIKNTFGTLEEEIFQATKAGEFNFARFTQSVLDDLTRITIRALIVKPIVEGILGYFSPSVKGTSAGAAYTDPGVMQAATGASFENGVKKFAAGGVVDRPTMFGYGGGKKGLMGEAGSEAILPLKRGADGNLGVASAASTPVVVNIINQAGAEVQQSEKSGPNGERILEVLIQRKVRDGFATGVFDKQLQNDFGIRRKGS